MKSVDRLTVVGVAGPRATVELLVSVQTNAPVDSTVTVLAYEIAFADDPPIARGGRLAPLQVPAGGVVSVRLPAELALGDLPEDLPQLAARGVVPYRASVWIEADTSLGRSQHRLEPRGEAPLAETFGAVVDGAFARDAGRIVKMGLPRLEGTEVATPFDVEFPGHLPFPIKVLGAVYDISIDGRPAGKGEATEPFVVTPKQGGVGRFWLRMPGAQIPEVLMKAALANPDVTIEGTVDIEPIGPIRRVPFRARTRLR